MSTEHDSLVRVEVNFEEFPFFQPRKAMRSGSYAYERTTEGENGTRLDQKWTVISSSESTLPGSFDMDVFISVLEVLERRGGMPASGTLEFSLYELAEILGVKLGGRTYEDLKESLERIALTSVRSENAFWVKGQKRHIMDTFRLWDITFDESQNRKGEKRSRHRVEFGKIFMRSFHDHYLRGLDTDLYRTLASPVAKRLYRIIDHARNGSGTWEADLKELQRQIPIGPYKYPAKIREKLAKPHEELVATGFLSSASYPDRERVLYEVAGDFLKTREDLALAGTNEEEITIKLLRESGLRGDVARDLVAKHGPETCTRYANALPYQQGLRNPAGWLRRAIEDSYEVQTRLPEKGTVPTSVDVEETEDVRTVSPSPDPDRRAQELFDAVLEDVSAGIDTPSFTAWFQDTIPVSFDGQTLTLSVPNTFAEEYIRTRFADKIEEALSQRLGEGASISITIYG